MRIEALVRHNGRKINQLQLKYGGRTSLFEARFELPEVVKDYEVLDITVTAAQAGTTNFGMHQRSIKLIP